MVTKVCHSSRKGSIVQGITRAGTQESVPLCMGEYNNMKYVAESMIDTGGRKLRLGRMAHMHLYTVTLPVTYTVHLHFCK